MRKIIYKIFIIIMLIICSISLISCKAITAQNITNTGSGQGMNGGGGMNGNTKGNGMMKADLTGKIISIDGNSIKIQLAEQTANNKSSNSNGGNQDAKDNQNSNNDNNKQPQGVAVGGMSEVSYTGDLKTITVNDNVGISQRQSRGQQNKDNNSKSATKVSDLEKGQVIMIWYKANTETVERISVIQS